MKKMLFVYNPLSGKGLIRSSLSVIIEKFTVAGYQVTIHPTQSVLDAAGTVQDHAPEYDLIVCSGGDGTLDEVVTGWMHSHCTCPIGYIPAGSTNDFGASLGLPKQMEDAADIITEGQVFYCDLGRFNEDYFVYVAAFGLFTDVSYQTPQDLKNALGHAAYLLEGMKRMGSWKSHYLKVVSDEFSDEGEFVFGMITNSNSIGGFKGIAGQNVELNDGLFEVMLVRTPQNLADWQDIITAVLTHDTRSKRAVMFRTRKMRIESQEPVSWTRDGENGGSHYVVELENLRESLPVLVPQSESEAVVRIARG